MLGCGRVNGGWMNAWVGEGGFCCFVFALFLFVAVLCLRF